MAQYRDLAGTPISAWRACPLCEVDFRERVEHAAKCPDCGRVFCDAGCEPVISDERLTYGQLTGATPYSALFPSQLETVTRPMAFLIRPIDMRIGPLFVADLEAEQRAFD